MKINEKSSRDTYFNILQYGSIFRHNGMHYMKVHAIRLGKPNSAVGIEQGILRTDFNEMDNVIYYPNAKLSLNE